MPPRSTKNEAGEEKAHLTQRDVEIVAIAWACVSSVKGGRPIVDSNKLATMGSYASADSARHVWKPVERKLLAIAAAVGIAVDSDSASAAGPATPTAAAPKPKAKGSGSARKRKLDASSDDALEETPAKKPRARPAKAGKAPKKPKAKKDSDLDDSAQGKDWDDGEV
ncbi:hypothetical protein F4781DRAFT_431682 [Annulohypoxylon bovei var. microspora]|nr:hypothetical protein F4781DRAFT_431682 [Annulohypoxylon bovei var. microspora]